MFTKRLIAALAIILAIISPVSAQRLARERVTQVELTTSEGRILLQLYNDTPIHRDNFVRNVKAGIYDGRTFNRVVPDFVIQCGEEQAEDTVTAEIRYPQRFHRRGVLAMGRCTDDPEHEFRSADQQFYIVWGKTYSADDIDKFAQRMHESTFGRYEMSDSVRQYYATNPGAPWLDGSFTIFGEVIDGLDVVERIQSAPTNPSTQSPLQPVVIKKAQVSVRYRSRQK